MLERVELRRPAAGDHPALGLERRLIPHDAPARGERGAVGEHARDKRRRVGRPEELLRGPATALDHGDQRLRDRAVGDDVLEAIARVLFG